MRGVYRLPAHTPPCSSRVHTLPLASSLFPGPLHPPTWIPPLCCSQTAAAPPICSSISPTRTLPAPQAFAVWTHPQPSSDGLRACLQFKLHFNWSQTETLLSAPKQVVNNICHTQKANLHINITKTKFWWKILHGFHTAEVSGLLCLC